MTDPVEPSHSLIRPEFLIGEIEHLPVLPDIVTDLLQSLDQEDLDITLLGKKVALDQVLTARILRVANASAYGGAGRAASIQQAISLLGIKMVRNLITTAAISSCFPEQHCAGFDFKAFWRHSLGTAVCAKVLARHLHLNQDLAFTAGLLHDIGRLVLSTGFPRQYERVLAYRAAHDCYLLDAERTMLGTDHVAAGNELARQWNFAPAIQLAINGHHTPDALGSGSIASLINVADAVAHALDLTGLGDDLVPPVALTAWNGVGLGKASYLKIFSEAELEFELMNTVL